jgi:hypothetical protein
MMILARVVWSVDISYARRSLGQLNVIATVPSANIDLSYSTNFQSLNT